uniref:hypothetical protein n=1 Tax=uncultured Clostridium sp. TaxID=59620 RepID=UPI0025927262
MNIDEFKKLSSIEQKKKKIMEYFNINEPVLIGSIKDRIPNKLWIHEISSIGGEEILNNPFNEFEELVVSVNLKDENPDLNIKDKVYFKFDINSSENILGIYPIVTQVKNIVKLIDIEKSDLPLKEAIIKSLRKRIENENINKLVIKEDIQKVLSEITDKCEKELITLEKK